MTSPLHFCFGVHLHQPVGNFDSVFEQHMTDVYRPMLSTLLEGEAWPFALHLSGPLLDWIEHHQPDWLEQLGRGVSDGQVELLTAGHDEPILAMLSPEDRIEQIQRHRASLKSRFGVEPTGLWLTERVWEPDLPESLARAGVEFALVDDRHFLATGKSRESLHRPWITETNGHHVALLPIDERLRYLVPFRPASELRDWLLSIRAEGHQLVVLADDGEKFGGWPGTADWVYRDGWMASFTATIRELRDSGEVLLSRFDAAVRDLPADGPVYLPTASYHEMEGWSLPPGPARALKTLEEELGEARMHGPEGALIRGSHWRNFLAKYPESNRLHKTMSDLSRRCRTGGDATAIRLAIGRAQCNDAYWHGVFGGLYLPFLRAALWRELATAERLLNQVSGPTIEHRDFDGDGRREVRVITDSLHLLLSPHHGGAIEVLLHLTSGVNLADVVTRHEESYHPTGVGLLNAEVPSPSDAESRSGVATIHDDDSTLAERPFLDRETRAILVDRFVPADANAESFHRSDAAIHSLANVPLQASWENGFPITLNLKSDSISKQIVISEAGELQVRWDWDSAAWGDELFTTELSLSVIPEIQAPGATRWEYLIETMSRSERGFDRTTQGTAVVLAWPAALGHASMSMDLRAFPPVSS